MQLGKRDWIEDSKFSMVNNQTVLYLYAKVHNFPSSGSMGCHKLKSRRRRRRRRRLTETIGAPNNPSTVVGWLYTTAIPQVSIKFWSHVYNLPNENYESLSRRSRSNSIPKCWLLHTHWAGHIWWSLLYLSKCICLQHPAMPSSTDKTCETWWNTVCAY